MPLRVISITMNQGPGSAGKTFEVGHHQNGLAVCQELQGRFPGLGTQYPKTISPIPSPLKRTRDRGGDHMAFLYSKYLHLAPSTHCCWIFSLLLCPNLNHWLKLLVIALDFQSDFTHNSCLFLTP